MESVISMLEEHSYLGSLWPAVSLPAADPADPVVISGVQVVVREPGRVLPRPADSAQADILG